MAGYPFVLSYQGDEFARLNFDGTWSVKWDKALNVRFEPVTLRNRAIVASAIVLVAARDNFYTTSWEQSDQWSTNWDHSQKGIDIRENDPEPNSIQFNISNAGEPCARVNFDGSWSIKWDHVDIIARTQKDNWRTLALAGFCGLLLAARDNFSIVQWNDNPPKDDDDE